MIISYDELYVSPPTFYRKICNEYVENKFWQSSMFNPTKETNDFYIRFHTYVSPQQRKNALRRTLKTYNYPSTRNKRANTIVLIVCKKKIITLDRIIEKRLHLVIHTHTYIFSVGKFSKYPFNIFSWLVSRESERGGYGVARNDWEQVEKDHPAIYGGVGRGLIDEGSITAE